jgi:hypothetical protein
MAINLDEHHDTDTLGTAEDVVAFRNNLDADDTPISIVRTAFRSRQLDGREPHVFEVLVEGVRELESLFPPDARVLRSVTDEDGDTVILARGVDYGLLASTIGRPLVSVSAATRERAKAVATGIRSRAPVRKPPNTTPIRTWFRGRHGPTSVARPLNAPRWSDIEANYPAATRAPLAALHALVRPRNTGKLVLWHGPPGTGKSTAVRSLFRAWSNWCDAHYVADPEAMFADPSYVMNVLAPVAMPWDEDDDDFVLTARQRRRRNKFRLIVAEDSDEFLRVSARQDAGASLGRLLNITDGVLGQGSNTIILLTTNEKLGELHPAVIRPGRCLAAIHFTEFSPAEAREWLGPSASAPNTPKSLAELFELRGDVTRVQGLDHEDAHPGQYL